MVGTQYSGYGLITLGDENSDGRVDVIARQDSSGDLYRYAGTGGTGTGTFDGGTKVGHGYQGMNGLLVGPDYNADAHTDVLALEGSGDLKYYPSDVGSGPVVGQLANPATSTMLPSGDLTGDGTIDLLVADGTGTVKLYPNTGSTTAPAYNSGSTTYLAGSQTVYDGSGTVGAAPTQGLPTRSNVAAATTGGTITWKQASRAGYDSYGRVVDAWDALDHNTHTAFTPATGGPVTAVAMTNAAGWTTTTTIEPVQGVPTRIVDANGKTTNASYDDLARVSAVWLDNRPTTATPDRHYIYTLGPTAPPTVKTDVLQPNGNTVASYQIYDGRLRPRQSQTPGLLGSTGGRIVTDTAYDNRGLPTKQSTFYNSAVPSSTLLAFADSDIANQHRYTYDNLSRPTTDALWTLNLHQWQASAAYDGDRTTITPPDGGTATRTLYDAHGQTVELDQYLGGSPTGAFQATHYGYDRLGQLTSMSDPGANTWSSTIDLRGRVTAQVDPDTGTTTMTYDDAGQLLSATDARGIVLSYDHDTLGRTTAEWQGASGTGTKLVDFTYDTLAKAQLTSARRYSGANTYTTAVTGYDDAYRPLGTTVTIPASEGFGQTSWTTTASYKVDGSLATTGLPAAGALPAETVSYAYWDSGSLRSITGASPYVTDAGYDTMGRLDHIDLGGDNGTHLVHAYDEATGRLDYTIAGTGGTAGTWSSWSDQLVVNYAYDDAGSTIAKSYTEADSSTSTECFQHDGLGQLSQAWTTTASICQATPTQAVVGGADPYWQSYTYDTIGDRASQVVHNAAGDTTYTYNYPTTHTQPHFATGVVATGASTGTSTYAPDAAGDTTVRSLAGQPGQTLTWDPEGHLATVTRSGQTTTYVYDAFGNRLLAKDADGSTLYVGDFDVHKTGSGQVTCARYYRFDDWNFATRSDNGTLTYLSQDHHGTTELSINAATNTVGQRLRTDPFGVPRDANTWPTTHGYVDGNTDPTGLTHLGARDYDTTTGRFASVDQFINLADPQQWNAYAYADNAPTTLSDWSGLLPYGSGSDIVGSMGFDEEAEEIADIRAVTATEEPVRVTAPPEPAATPFEELGAEEQAALERGNTQNELRQGRASDARVGIKQPTAAPPTKTPLVKGPTPRAGGTRTSPTGRSDGTGRSKAGDDTSQSTPASVASATAPKVGQTVYRVWGGRSGGGARPFGKYWTRVDPRTVEDYRAAAALPNRNPGRFLSIGRLRTTKGVTLTEEGAVPLEGHSGGIDELELEWPGITVKLEGVEGLNPEF